MIKEYPKFGDVRIRRKFAWWFTDVEDCNIIFEYYYTKEVYSQGRQGWSHSPYRSDGVWKHEGTYLKAPSK